MGSWRTHKIGWALIGSLALISLFQTAHMRWSFGLNMTESLPYWAFVVDHQRSPVRGELAVFLPPANPYYDDEFVKRVVGVPGDRIRVVGRGVYVADVYVGEAKTHSQDGREMEVISEQDIPEGFVFVMGDHLDSYDSRYAEIGLIPVESILGVAKGVL